MSDDGVFEASKPTWVGLAVYCSACGQDWDDWQPSGCALDVWLAVMPVKVRKG